MSGELNEKLKEIINDKIIPTLIEDTAGLISEEELVKDAKRPRFTIIFDREAYEPNFFKSLWEKYCIAVITYRKAVKDKWSVEEFADYKTHVIGKEVKMCLAE